MLIIPSLPIHYTTPESTAERSALTDIMQGECHLLIATPNEWLNYSLPVYRRN